jgi:hypothetical protein
MQVIDRLRAASRSGQPVHSVHVGGRLTDSAIGAIYVCKMYSKTRESPGEPVMGILKSMDLNEQNVYSVANSKKTTLRGLPANSSLYLSNSSSDAKLWHRTWCTDKPETTIANVCWLEAPLEKPRDLATRVLQCNEYLTEAMVGLIVSQHVPVPHFIKTYDAWIGAPDDSGPTGFLLQEYGGTPLLKACVDLSLAEFQSVILQTLVALAVGQETVALKHHDMHLDNVFVFRNKRSADDGTEANVMPGDYWAYTLQTSDGPTTFYVKHGGLLAKIGDWGLASATDPVSKARVERVDYPLLDATEVEWGQWSGALEGQESYDAVTLLSKMFLEDEVSMMSKPQVQWARDAYRAITAAQPQIACSNIGRPFRGREGRMTVADILRLPFFSDLLQKPDAIGAVHTAYSGERR